MINFNYSPAYFAGQNERAKRAKRAMSFAKSMMELNTPMTNFTLQEILSLVNARESTVEGGGSAYKGLFGRSPTLDLAQLSVTISGHEEVNGFSAPELQEDNK